jgi:hypothetical protein
MLFGSIIVIGLATAGTFELFAPSFLWKAYNYYFLGMIEGRLDVPVEAIGLEGGYHDSKAYMYYGLLPTLVRSFLYPFIDLTQTPISSFSVLFFTLVGNAAVQASLISVFFKQKLVNQNTTGYLLLFGLSILFWFGSGSFMISQNATIYHEPYAASLCLVNIYLALLLKDSFFIQSEIRVNIVPYALLAGLCIHARMPTALALYLVTGIILLVQTLRIGKSSGISANIVNIVILSFKSFWPAITILALFGFSFFLLNYVKYGNAFAFMGVNNGYYFLEGFTLRRCNVIPTSEFSNYVRIIPNTAIYLTGSQSLHWSLTWHLATGFGRVESPIVPLLFLWPLPILCMLGVFIKLVKDINNHTNKVLLLALLAFSTGAFFQLKYATITHRYTAEFWVPLFVSVLFIWFKLITKNKNTNSFSPYMKVGLLSAGFLLFSSVGYQLYLATTDKYYLKDGPIYKHENYHYSTQDNEYLATLTPEKIKKFNEEYRRVKEQECAKLKLVEE